MAKIGIGGDSVMEPARVNPAYAVLNEYSEAQIKLNEAQHDVRVAKQKLVELAIQLNALDALSVNVSRLRRITGVG